MRKTLTGVALAAASALCMGVGTASAATTPQDVTESDVVRLVENAPPPPGQDWVVYTRVGTPPSAAQFVTGPATPPEGDGSLKLTTATGSEKVFAFNFNRKDTPLGDIDQIGYSTYRTAGSGNQLPGFNIQVDFNGDAPGGFTTLVYEPVYNNGSQAITNNTWQTWDADAGRWWSTAAINGQCPGATISCMRTWSQIVANNPAAVVTGGYGVNQGSGNAGLVAYVDALAFDDQLFDFENDGDSDGVGDGNDNCPTTANANQTDADNDGIGDACEADGDGDGVIDDNDNCPADSNADQANNDGDGQGDVCDADDDNDGVNDTGDNCPVTSNPGQADADGDGIGTACDSSELPASKEQCKNDGWRAFYDGTARFKNQGDCVSSVASKK